MCYSLLYAIFAQFCLYLIEVFGQFVIRRVLSVAVVEWYCGHHMENYEETDDIGGSDKVQLEREGDEDGIFIHWTAADCVW